MRSKSKAVFVFFALALIAGCSSGDPSTGTTSGGDGGAGGGSASSSTNTATVTASATTGTGGEAPTPWTVGLVDCKTAGPVTAKGTYSLALQQLFPPDGSTVEEIDVAVWRDATTGGPFPIVFSVAFAPGVFSGVFQEWKIDESDVIFQFGAGDTAGFAKVKLAAPVKLKPGQSIWVGNRLDKRPAPELPTSTTLCTEPTTGGFDSYVTTGACPGTGEDCALIVPPLPARPDSVIWAFAKGT